MNILSKIVATKKLEIVELYRQHDLSALQAQCAEQQRSTPLFYQALAHARNAGQPFFISEFKRKSPSEGWINQHADLPAQLGAYTKAGAGAISVLTDTDFFGGAYADLLLASETLHGQDSAQRPLLLQKDFILDPIQIYLARLHGADIILLIAAILEAPELDALKKTAESLGMGVLVEVHDQEELDKIQHLEFPVLGINNRDLKTFRTALNRVNVLRQKGAQRFIISESGIRDAVDFQMVRQADGFLIGTGLMRRSDQLQASAAETFSGFFQSKGKLLFKACGIRTPEMLDVSNPDFIGINFSPLSKRRAEPALREKLKQKQAFPPHLVAVFYKNTESEIRDILETYPFQTVQLYANDCTPEFVRSLRLRVLLAVPVRTNDDLDLVERFAADVDCFILDGAAPGSGQTIEVGIPAHFPYPFLLAGGIHAGNLERVRAYENCIGVDVASGIEVDGKVNRLSIETIAKRLAQELGMRNEG
ncbi:MAG: bifunctional indole-3-glycerol phosphate synthase/phosphoribosylanthranilate isomerase [Saprospiraceae bacterium]|nr:bifunctional indole-3-glycerol phosphate synthase/phosphoribosylanthranilate isomerase [Saprospiraceae bacterium]